VQRPWTATPEVAPELARRRIPSALPGLAAARLEPLGAGWDNTAYPGRRVSSSASRGARPRRRPRAPLRRRVRTDPVRNAPRRALQGGRREIAREARTGLAFASAEP